MERGRTVGKGRDMAVAAVRVQPGLCWESVQGTEGGRLLLRDKCEGLHTSRSPTLLLPPLIPSSAVSLHSAGGQAGFLLSQPLFLLKRSRRKKISPLISTTAQERAAFKNCYFARVLTRLLAFIFLVSTLFSAVIFLMFS